MGCDIHMVLEYYDDRNDLWVGLHDYPFVDGEALSLYSPRGNTVKDGLSTGWISWKYRERNYELFGELASVRGTSSQGRIPVRLPDDCSALTRLRVQGWGHDAHSHSWMSLKEFITCVAYVEGKLVDLVQERITAEDEESKEVFNQYVKAVTGEFIGVEDIDKYRIVFWFDN